MTNILLYLSSVAQWRLYSSKICPSSLQLIQFLVTLLYHIWPLIMDHYINIHPPKVFISQLSVYSIIYKTRRYYFNNADQSSLLSHFTHPSLQPNHNHHPKQTPLHLAILYRQYLPHRFKKNLSTFLHLRFNQHHHHLQIKILQSFWT